jgi:hypothetical protein
MPDDTVLLVLLLPKYEYWHLRSGAEAAPAYATHTLRIREATSDLAEAAPAYATHTKRIREATSDPAEAAPATPQHPHQAAVAQQVQRCRTGLGGYD